jgi:hypothetical protein
MSEAGFVALYTRLGKALYQRHYHSKEAMGLLIAHAKREIRIAREQPLRAKDLRLPRALMSGRRGSA